MAKLTTFKVMQITFSGENPENYNSILSKLSEITIFEEIYQDNHALCVQLLYYGEAEFQSFTVFASKIAKDYNMNVMCEDIPL